MLSIEKDDWQRRLKIKMAERLEARNCKLKFIVVLGSIPGLDLVFYLMIRKVSSSNAS